MSCLECPYMTLLPQFPPHCRSSSFVPFLPKFFEQFLSDESNQQITFFCTQLITCNWNYDNRNGATCFFFPLKTYLKKRTSTLRQRKGRAPPTIHHVTVMWLFDSDPPGWLGVLEGSCMTTTTTQTWLHQVVALGLKPPKRLKRGQKSKSDTGSEKNHV